MARLRAPVPALPLDLFRILTGLVVVGYLLRKLLYAPVFTAGDGLIDHALSEDIFWFAWQPLFRPSMGVAAVRSLLGAACIPAVCIVVGWAPRRCALAVYAVVVCLYRHDLLRGLLHPEFLASHSAEDPFKAFLGELPWRELVGRAPVHILLYAWMKSHFAGYVLGAERLDMAHSVEVRLPYLDHHLFDFTKRLPPSLLLKGGRNKDLLRRAVAPYVSPAVLAEPKRPFVAPPTAVASPGGSSRKNPFAKLIRELIDDSSFAALPFFDPAAVRRLLDRLDRPAPGSELQAAAADPILYLLASLAVLQRHYRPAS